MENKITKTSMRVRKRPILLEEHYRSYSDGNINVIGLEDSAAAGVCNKQPSPAVVVNVAARQIDSPTLQGYLDRKMESSDEWVNIWGVLKEDTLYVYSEPIDECSIDAVTVPDWQVQQTDTIENKPNVLILKNDVYDNQYYSCDSPLEFDQWKRELAKLGKKGSSQKPAMANRCVSVEEVDQQKNELLKYVLSQRKQAIKSIQARRASTSDNGSQDTNASGSDGKEDFIMVDDDQNWKDMTHMMHRKVSMQLKLGSLQKSLIVQNKKTPSKRKFKLPFNKSSKSVAEPERTAPAKENIVKQVKDLNYQLTSLQVDIDEKVQQMRSTDISPTVPEHFAVDRPFYQSNEDKSKFKLPMKLAVPKVKNSFSSADLKMRDVSSTMRPGSEKTKYSSAMRHSWSADMWRNEAKDEDFSPTSPESSTSSSPDHKVSRLSLYTKKMPAPSKSRHLSSIKDLESPQEEPEELNMSLGSSNCSQETNYQMSTALDTPMKDMVYRNNNKHQRTKNDNQSCHTLSSSNEDTVSSDLELDCVNGNRRKSISKDTLAKIEVFEDFIKKELGL